MLENISRKAEALVFAAQQAGATASDASVSLTHSIAVSVREGKSKYNANESDALSLRVFVGQCVASVTRRRQMTLDEIASRAVAMAKVSPEDLHASIIDGDKIAQTWPDLDLLDENKPSASQLTDLALTMEKDGLGCQRVTKSSSASASRGKRGTGFGNVRGFFRRL